MKKTIAIIDDDTVLLGMLKQVLEEENYIVKTYSHTVFIDVLEQENYDLLMLDVWFDTFRAGIEMAQAVLNRAQLRKKPIIMMSSDGNLEEYASKAGVENYLSKPLDFEAVLEVVKNLSKTKKTTSLSLETATYSQSRGQISADVVS